MAVFHMQAGKHDQTHDILLYTHTHTLTQSHTHRHTHTHPLSLSHTHKEPGADGQFV